MQGISKETQRRSADSYRFGEFELNPAQRTLHREGEPIPLQPKAFDTLLMLVENASRLVRKEELQDTIWPETFVSDASLTNIIVMLRKVLGRDAIETVPKHGYRFKAAIDGEPGVAGEVFALFVRAKDLTRARSIEAMVEARALLWLAIAQDPGFAEAWAWLGRCCRFIHKFGVDSGSSLELAATALERSLMIDRDLASAHRFYTLLEADTGKALQAMIRLLDWVSRHPRETDGFASLVQVLRYCGLGERSVAAHQVAVALDPAVTTGVAHTHFAQCEYQAAIETYDVSPGFYLDAAAWAALGETDHAATLLRE